jgi:hypothetical protein
MIMKMTALQYMAPCCPVEVDVRVTHLPVDGGSTHL